MSEFWRSKNSVLYGGGLALTQLSSMNFKFGSSSGLFGESGSCICKSGNDPNTKCSGCW